jgi:Domain of unknown function (DUF4145)
MLCSWRYEVPALQYRYRRITRKNFVNLGEGVTHGGKAYRGVVWFFSHQRCPDCFESIIYLESGPAINSMSKSFLAYPQSRSRPVPVEVVDPYRQDFMEACKVLQDSPKASAALSRRCLQAILRDKAKTKAKDLYDQIEEITSSGTIPPILQKISTRCDRSGISLLT